jgi:hypothetical protein
VQNGNTTAEITVEAVNGLGYSEISGTMTMTLRPPSSTCRIARRNTSVLPEPVTP